MLSRTPFLKSTDHSPVIPRGAEKSLTPLARRLRKESPGFFNTRNQEAKGVYMPYYIVLGSNSLHQVQAFGSKLNGFPFGNEREAKDRRKVLKKTYPSLDFIVMEIGPSMTWRDDEDENHPHRRHTDEEQTNE